MKKKTFFLNEKVQRPKHFIRVIAHVNIGLQVAFPLAISFTPVMVARAETEEKKYSIINNSAKADIYVLRPDDTLKLIAEKYQISVAELKTFNQYRAFAHGFESVSVGDEIDVPAQSQNIAIDAGSSDSAELAQRAQQAGNFLQNNLSADSAKDLARGQALGAANSKANQEVASWLNGKGKARVKLDADRDFSLKNSELDVLYPLWENNAHQIFTQGSVHHTDSRNQSNLGLGYRYFEGTYMLGANTFFDHDWSRSHSRLGLGAEYQRDFLKVAANAYMRLTNWKNSPDFDNYEERPANGWDIRTEGYLPDYPGIGGKLVYEKYYGNRVGLFGKDNQQKNPVAVTAGVNYSPFPLMKFNIDHRMGKSNQNDTRFGIDLNYVLGAPLSQQLDSSMLAASRSLAANRYDFVDRNNNIVLEYRKKDTISLRLASQISGYSGESKSLGVSVNSTNGVERIEWIAPELLSQGGQIVQVSEQQFNVIIPEYQYGSDANNSYVVSGVAYDKSGNASPKAESLIVVASAAVSKVNSTLTPMELQLPNDGHSTAELTLVLRDANNHPISGVADYIKITVSQTGRTQPDARVSTFSEDVDRLGTYMATVTAGKNMGEYKLTPEIQNIKIALATLYVGKAPMISHLTISGKLALGEQLSGHYQFDSNNGNVQDASLYQWGNEGQTTGLNNAETIVTSGSVPSYTLVTSDVGQVKELSVRARNGVETLGNTLTVTTAPNDSGNNTEGGGDGGIIVDEQAAPSIRNVAISGKLAVGEILSGSYVFEPNTGNPRDTSQYQWGEKDTTASLVNSGSGDEISDSGVIPSYTIVERDAGRVLEMSVLAKNGANVSGNTATVTTAQQGDGNNTEGGNGSGNITNEQAAPSIRNAAISGKLAVGEVLSGSYVFEPNTGNPRDTSQYLWGEKDTTASLVNSGSGDEISDSGVIPGYTIVGRDAGRVLEMSVRAKNGANVSGNTATVTTAQQGDGNNTEGGNGSGNITNEQAAPSISNVAMKGTLAVGENLSGSYTFEPHTGNPTDTSEYLWGVKGSTAAKVESGKGQRISQSGVVPDYSIEASDAGQVLEMSVRAKNGANVSGNTATVTTAQQGDGNNTEGGNGSGNITNEQAAPSISNVAMKGTLAVGENLSGSYTFEPHTGNPTDTSEYQWGVKGSTAAKVESGKGQRISQSGVVPDYSIEASDAGQVLEMSVRAKNGANVSGNTATVTTAQQGDGNNTEGGNGSGNITNEQAAPSIRNAAISGKLAVGEVLSGSYVFEPNTGNPTDTSEYLWGVKGSTTAKVESGKGQRISQSGVVPDYSIEASDAGQVLEMSVRAKNGANVSGNTATVTTAQQGDGNNTEGGNGSGNITNEQAAPSIRNAAISGKLAVGEVLRGSYVFEPNTGNPRDTSQYLWGEKDTTASLVNSGSGDEISDSGVIPSYTIVDRDAGQVLEMSVRAKNGANVSGNTATVTTAQQGDGNNTEGGNGSGNITNEQAAPSIRNAAISGKLAVGEVLSGSYVFEPNTGNPRDTSQYLWGEKDTTASLVNSGSGDEISDSGVIPGYTIVERDAGRVLEMSVRAKNGANVSGNTATVTTAQQGDGNNTEGGNGSGNITNEQAAPSISNVAMKGTLAVGENLSGSYTFEPHTGNPTDTSEYQWGVKGSTAAKVESGKGQRISQSGVVPDYSIKASDAGQVLEMSVRAKNGANVSGNTATVTTAQQGDGNNTEGGNGSGNITNEQAAPSICNAAISGKLAVGEVLSGSYTFEPHTGNPTDTSEYLWGVKGSTTAKVESGKGQRISQSGVVPDYSIEASDAGQVLEMSVRAKNGANVSGNTATVTTAQQGDGNNTEGGNGSGNITNEQAAPSIRNAAISGKLAVGEVLSGSYVFEPNTGNPRDTSQYLWGEKDTTASLVNSGSGDEISDSGVIPGYSIEASDVGQVLEMSVRAKNGANVSGNTATVTTAQQGDGNNTEGGNGSGNITNEQAAPSIRNAAISGKLAVGEVLSGSYVFEPNTGNPTDTSEYLWGVKGSTTAKVESGKGQRISQSGVVPDYSIESSDAGQVLEMSVRAKNGANVSGNTATVTTAQQGDGNNTEGGNGSGNITNEQAAPSIRNAAISGKLAVGEVLSGSYVFEPNTGNPRDTSQYLWGEKDTTASLVNSGSGDEISDSGVIPGYTIVGRDAGRVLEMSVRAKNGANVSGNTATVTTAQQGDGNNIEGGGEGGTIVDERAAPSISNVAMKGTLAVGENLSGSYTFEPHTGNPTDTSEYLWGVKGSTTAKVESGKGQRISQSGVVPDYSIEASDAGQVLEMSVRAKNGANVSGNTATVTTAQQGDGNNTEGGNGSGNITNEQAAPSIRNAAISGKLAVGEVLSGSYVFEPNTGNPRDTSQYLWGEKDTTASLVNSGSGDEISDSGVIPGYTIVERDAGQVLEMSVRAKNGANVSGNTATVTTAQQGDGNNIEGGGEGGTIVDERAAPSISNVAMKGTLAVGENLSGSYTFEPHTGNPTDTSEYLWGVKGSTTAKVESGKGQRISQSGVVPDYSIEASDAGQVLEMSVRAKNGANVSGNTATVTTAQQGDGNNTEGGNGSGNITNEQAAPSIRNAAISGKLAVGEVLSGSYVFEPNTGNPRDMSQYLWGEKDTTASLVNSGSGDEISDSGVIPGYSIEASDVGQVLEMSVRAKNGANVSGNTATVTTAQQGDGNNTEGGNGSGNITNEQAAPSIRNAAISGKLAVGEVLSGSYVFEPNTGNPRDTSQYLWGEKDTTASLVNSGSGDEISDSGVIPGYTIVERDAGRVLEMSVRAKNGANVSGNTATVTTAQQGDGNNTEGGNGSGNITNEQAAPSIRNAAISGKLAVGEVLSGSYVFEPNTGNPRDTSQYLWGEKDTTASLVNSGSGDEISDSGVIPGYTIVERDAGRVLEMSVRAKNGANVSGNTATVTTAQQGDGNSTEGGNDNGEVINTNAEPIVGDLKISGNISIGEMISATYKFDANKNINKDRTLYLWGPEGTTASKVNSGKKIEISGTVPGYKVTNDDLGKVLEVSIQANNAFDVKGNTLTANLAIKEKTLPENTIISSSDFGFKVSDKFPTTGYDGANFRIELDDANSYIWRSNASWVDVSDDGLVTLKKNGDGKPVQISIIKKDGSYQMIYEFKITKWFFISSNQISKKTLDSSCQKEGMSPVPRKIATNANIGDSWGVRGATNQLWPEWGGGISSVAVFWLEEEFFSVYSITGSIAQEEGDESLKFICYKQL